MPAINITQVMQMAIGAHNRRQWSEAERLYRQVLSADPRQADALHLLGVLLHQSGRTQQGVELIRRAILLKPQTATFYANLAIIYQEIRQFQACAECLQQACALDPSNINLRLKLGYILNEELLRHADAAAVFKAILAADARSLGALVGLGIALHKLGDPAAAIDYYRPAQSLAPADTYVLSNFATALLDSGESAQAIEMYHAAIAIAPTKALLWYNLGVAHMSLQATEEAIAALQKAHELNPQDMMTQVNLAAMLNARGDVSQAVERYAKLLEKHPGIAELHSNLGMALQSQGRQAEAIAPFRQAIALDPEGKGAYDNLLMGLHYCAEVSAEEIILEHGRWGERMSAQIPVRGVSRDHSPDRRLRIGYVSPDFRRHSVSYFIEPILCGHDHRAFEVFCYANQPINDETTRRLRSYADHWRNIYKLSDDAAADLIEKDQIDILIDLAVHTHANRLKIFARKPAPVQGTWLGYAGTTGLSTVDFRITDDWVDPRGASEALHTEKLVRLPDTQWVYRPPREAPGMSALPAKQNGYVTFGVATNFAKITEQTLRMWGEVLRKVPLARLIIKGSGAADPGTQKRFVESFANAGVGADRLSFETSGSLEEYFGFFSRIDLVLDTFPFAGGTTSCHALYMGVPMVTRMGGTSVSRVGASLLHQVGLGDLIASSEEEFVRIVVDLAMDMERLAKIRAGLREAMKSSPLMNEALFVKNLETAYRDIWKQWCRG